MKFYALLTIWYNDGKDNKVSVYTYDTLEEAVSQFHKQYGANMAADNVDHVMCAVINSDGRQMKSEYWTRGEDILM